MSNYPSDNTNNDQRQISRGRLKAFLSRRRLLSSTIFGGTAALVLSIPEANQAQVIDNKTSVHVEKFLAAIHGMLPLSNYDQDLFIKAANSILSIVEKDANARSSCEALQTYISQPLIKVESEYNTTSLGLPQEVSNTIAAAYLRAIETLRRSPLSEEALLTKLNNPKAIFDNFEEDFIALLSQTVQAEVQSYAPYSNALSEATEQIISIGKNISTLKKSYQNQQRVGCLVNGNSSPVWMCGAGGVIVIIIIVVALK